MEKGGNKSILIKTGSAEITTAAVKFSFSYNDGQ
jgi:hypothetical protein